MTENNSDPNRLYDPDDVASEHDEHYSSTEDDELVFPNLFV